MGRPKTIEYRRATQNLQSLRDQHAPQHSIDAAQRRVESIIAYHWKPSRSTATATNRAVDTIQHVDEQITAEVKWKESASQEHQANEEDQRIAAEEQQKFDEEFDVLFNEMERRISQWEQFLMEVEEIDNDAEVTKNSLGLWRTLDSTSNRRKRRTNAGSRTD